MDWLRTPPQLPGPGQGRRRGFVCGFVGPLAADDVGDAPWPRSKSPLVGCRQRGQHPIPVTSRSSTRQEASTGKEGCAKDTTVQFTL